MKQRKSKSGSALIFVLVFMVLGVTMGTALIFLTQSDMQAAVTNMRYEQTYYDAETAAQMATQLAIHKINTNLSYDTLGNQVYNSPLTYVQTVPIQVGSTDFGDFGDGPYLESRYIKKYEYAWFKQETAISGIDYPPPPYDDDPVALARRTALQSAAGTAIDANLTAIELEIQSALSNAGITAEVSISFNPEDLERQVYFANAKEAARIVTYDYIVRWALVPDAPILIQTTVNGRTLQSTLSFRGQDISWSSADGFAPQSPEESFIKVSPPTQPGTGLGAVHNMPRVLIPMDEDASFMTSYNSSDEVQSAYEGLHKGIGLMYKEVMETKVGCSYTAGGDEVTADIRSSDSFVITVKPEGGVVSLTGEWPNLTTIYVDGPGKVQLGVGTATNGSDAILAPLLETIHAPEADVVFADCNLSNMEHCCMNTVTFGGTDGYGTFIFHSERDAIRKPYCEMVVGGASALPTDDPSLVSNPSGVSTRVFFEGKLGFLDDAIIFSAGRISSSTEYFDSVSCNSIFFTAGDTEVPFKTSGTDNSPQFYTWGNLIVGDSGGLSGVYACTGDLTVTNWGNTVACYLIGSTVNLPGNTPNLYRISNMNMAPFPDLFAERIKLYTMGQGIQFSNVAPFNIISVLTEDMGQGLVSVVTEGHLFDTGIDSENLFFDGIREIR